MSVVGFDVGNDTSCVALARKRGIDVIMNKESKRETPAAVNFGDKMRFLGTEGAAKLGLSPQNTVHQLKRLLGKKFNDPQVQADIARFPFKVLESPEGNCQIQVTFCGEVKTFTPEQVMAMVIVDLKSIAEQEGGVPVTDCALSVPAYFTEAERYAMLNAAQIAGVNCLRLTNETTATALAYGIYKTDLPETDPVYVAFVDVGHSSTQASVVALKRNQLRVLSHAWDRSLGGRDFDEALFEHFAAEFKAKTRCDVTTNKKAGFKLRAACERLKKILSANSEAPLNVECLMDDQDMRSSMNRETFEKLAEPVLSRLHAPLQKALAMSGISADQISSVEVVGSTTRTPAVFRAVEEVFGKAPSRTMNSKECVSRGAALQCAMLSPVFRVREFEVIDASPFSVQLTWEKEGVPVTQTLFKAGEAFPSNKLINFNRSEPFSVTAHYSEDSDVPAAFNKVLGTYRVGDFAVPEGHDHAKLKVKVALNLHGLVHIENVHAVEEIEVIEHPPAAPAAEDTPMSDAAPEAAAGGNGDGAAAPEAAAKTEGGNGDGAAPAAEGETPAAKPEGGEAPVPPAAADAEAPAAEAAAADAKSGGEAPVPPAAEAADASGPTPMETDAAPAAEPAPKAEPKKVKKLIRHEVKFEASGVHGLSLEQVQAYFQHEHEMQKVDRLQEETNEAKNTLEEYVYAARSRVVENSAVAEADREAVLKELQEVEDWLYEDGEDTTREVYVAKYDALRLKVGGVEGMSS